MSQVAQNILSQLGANRFLAMTGAKQLVAGERSLQFSLPRNASKANKCRITLTAADDYTVEFFAIRKFEVIEKARFDGVFCDSLRAVFTRATGFDTSL